MNDAAHVEEVLAWRRRREERLRDPDGWLSLVGLEWLHAGENRVGGDARADVRLRGVDAPSHAGSIFVEDGAARFVTAPGAQVTRDERPVGELALRDDLDGAPTMLAIGSLRFHLIRRGDRLGIRVHDRAAPGMAAFRGLDSFPIDPTWRVTARFEPASGRTVPVPDVIGLLTDEPSPGSVVFERDGSEYGLDALEGGHDGRLWLVFGDATNGGETYGGGRFLYTEPPGKDGTMVADFNLTYNPPCVFSPYATCPLPWPQNRLPIRIEAGEKSYRTPG